MMKYVLPLGPIIAINNFSPINWQKALEFLKPITSTLILASPNLSSAQLYAAIDHDPPHNPEAISEFNQIIIDPPTHQTFQALAKPIYNFDFGISHIDFFTGKKQIGVLQTNDHENYLILDNLSASQILAHFQKSTDTQLIQRITDDVINLIEETCENSECLNWTLIK